MALTRRQREIYDYVSGFVEERGYSPSLEEIAGAFGLSSVATVHKHVKHLVEKGYLRKAWNRSRSVEPVPATSFSDAGPGEGAIEGFSLPILGTVAAGSPIEAIEPDAASAERLSVPADMVYAGAGRGFSRGQRRGQRQGQRHSQSDESHYVLRVRGDSMIEDQICDGDLVVIEARNEARNGETVVALVEGRDATLKRFYRNGSRVRLVPANAAMQAIEVHASEVEIRGVVRGLIRHF